MSLSLHTISPAKGSKHRNIRKGRGNSAGKGTYAGRGLKGQRSRSGGRQGLKYKGFKRNIEQMKKRRGFTSLQSPLAVVNLSDINKQYSDNDRVTPFSLEKSGLISSRRSGVKVLGIGELSRKLVFKGLTFSETARSKIEKRGSTIEEKSK